MPETAQRSSFIHRSQQSIIEIFEAIGDELRDRTISAITKSSEAGLLCNDAMDVSVVEQFIGFVQFSNSTILTCRMWR